MPLFWSKKTKAEKNYDQAAAPKVKSAVSKPMKPKIASESKPAVRKASIAPVGDFTTATESVLRPRITEKSSFLAQNGTYTFEISRDANKRSVAKAVAELYKVTPVKIALINLPAKNVFVRGKSGRVAGIRKALVTIKKGEKIDIV
ncbi:MAG: 50S ribosomal protein L23 [Candidatus Taylorbacteria bacterium]|nr:50S ribosomal protein L23 [Candidatus Taylorbacteria bacterium]